MEKENITNDYYKRLVLTKNPGYVLNEMYSEIFETQLTDTNTIMFSRLVKLYGRENVFFALLDITNIQGLVHNNLYPLLSAICKRYIVEIGTDYSPTLSALSKKETKRKIKIGDPFGE